MEAVKLVCYEVLLAGWYMEDIKGELDELVGYRPIDICEVQPDLA